MRNEQHSNDFALNLPTSKVERRRTGLAVPFSDLDVIHWLEVAEPEEAPDDWIASDARPRGEEA